ncbi:hypothetical protein [Actinocrispum sp. NPDC049592]|uniref:hypothetical protein n=1 Tax=Actinocrispum sp. NPDC049592 TaxID=3154835 RepID=UPI003429D3BB
MTEVSRRSVLKAGALAAGALAVGVAAEAAGGVVLGTVRVGQLTGTTSGGWPNLVDAQGWPLLSDLGRVGVEGVDLGATTTHNGRSYFFFGDVLPTPGSPNKRDADLVAWADDATVLQHGGHAPNGYTFVLPSEERGNVNGQHQWRFCGGCSGLFYDGDTRTKGVCSRGGSHWPIGEHFILPNVEMGGGSGQGDWRFCGQCMSLFFNGYPSFKGACPAGGPHSAIGWTFILPYEPTGVPGQHGWRYCGWCAGVFWNGDVVKGVCPGAPGGGIVLRPVLGSNGAFDPIRSGAPIGQTLTFEVPSGAFSHNNKVYLFLNISPRRWSTVDRPGDPAFGVYLTSKTNPDQPGEFHKEFLFSPRLGACRYDANGAGPSVAHDTLGYTFVLPHGIQDGTPRQNTWRRCRKCDSMFAVTGPSRCHAGGAHEDNGTQYTLPYNVPADSQNQAKWCQCENCSTLFYTGDPSGTTGLCPAGGSHQSTGNELVLPFISMHEDGSNQEHWRYCGKCQSLFFDGYDDKGKCPAGGGHQAIGFDFVVPHDRGSVPDFRSGWAFCDRCSSMFRGGVCPAGGAHRKAGYDFCLPYGFPETRQWQGSWRGCRDCGVLFFDGYPAKGRCPVNAGGHRADGETYVLPHNPGWDNNNEGAWRFCPKCFGMVFAGRLNTFGTVAPVVVNNADHPGLPSNQGKGLVIVAHGFGDDPSWADGNGFRVAWLPLRDNQDPVLHELRYYKGNGQWTDDADDAVQILPPHKHYTSLSVSWIPQARRWIMLYSNAAPENKAGNAVVRIGTSPWDWSAEQELINSAQAYGKWMHQKDRDGILNIPPVMPEEDGWFYGLFLVDRYTQWDAANRILDIHYLLSPNRPYQVQLMRSRLRLD